MIAIIDYGVGNLQSVRNALLKVGFSAEIIQKPEQLKKASHAILPGVGAFGAAMANLELSGFIPEIMDFIQSGKPFMGICLGLQLLFTKSEEVFGGEQEPQGLGLIPGVVKRFPEGGLKVPQIGWNKLEYNQDSPLWSGLSPGVYTYFVHSFYAAPAQAGDILCTSHYGIEYCAGIQKGNLMALQFHPEKSGQVGLTMLKNFGGMTP